MVLGMLVQLPFNESTVAASDAFTPRSHATQRRYTSPDTSSRCHCQRPVPSHTQPIPSLHLKHAASVNHSAQIVLSFLQPGVQAMHMTVPDPVMMPAAICYQIIFLEKIKCGGIRKLEAISVGCSLMGTTTKERQDAEATWLRYLVANFFFSGDSTSSQGFTTRKSQKRLY